MYVPTYLPNSKQNNRSTDENHHYSRIGSKGVLIMKKCHVQVVSLCVLLLLLQDMERSLA